MISLLAMIWCLLMTLFVISHEGPVWAVIICLFCVFINVPGTIEFVGGM